MTEPTPDQIRAMQHVAAAVVLAMRDGDPDAATAALVAYEKAEGRGWGRAVCLTAAKLAADRLSDEEAAKLAAAYPAEEVIR